MRIALVTDSPCSPTDSTSTTLVALLDRLSAAGHDLRLVAPAPGGSTRRGVDVVRVRPLDAQGRQVRTALEDHRPDVVVALSSGTLGRKALKHTARTGTPSLLVEQSPVLDLAADYWRAKVAGRADRVLVTSTWMVDRAAELGVDAQPWLPGVDTDAFTPALRDQWLHDAWSRSRTADGPQVVVGFVGPLHRRHGVRRLADLARVPGVRPVVIGDGSHREWLEARLPGARFTGSLPSGDLSIALPTLDLLVHPGEHETCAHALRQAAASGVPVVAPRAGGALDVVRHQETGLLHDPGDDRAFRRAVTALVGDRHRHLMGARAREVALSRTWADAVDELLERHLEPSRNRVTSS